MKKQKVYFSDIDETYAWFAYPLDCILDEMKDRGLTEIEVSEAERESDPDYFYCKAAGEVFIKPPEGEPCGKECPDYNPRNGKSGCCKFRGYCYTPGKNFILTIGGKLTPKT